MAMHMIDPATLSVQRCRPTVSALEQADIDACLQALPGWQQDGQRIVKTYAFRDFHATMAFLDAAAVVIHAEDHHPELLVSYARCVVRYDTHSVNGGKGGISLNDFICAAKFDALYRQCADAAGAR